MDDALLRSVVQECIEQGRLDKKSWDAELVAQTLWAGVHGLCALEIAIACDKWVPWRSIKARSNHLLDTLLNGILPR